MTPDTLNIVDEWKMELESKEWNLAKSQDVILSDSKKLEESKKHKLSEENDKVEIKRQKLSEDNENLECLRNICEVPFEEDGTASLPTAQSTAKTESKPNVAALKKKKKKKKSQAEATPKAKEVKPKNEKAKGHMRKNIRDILKQELLNREKLKEYRGCNNNNSNSNNSNSNRFQNATMFRVLMKKRTVHLPQL